MMLVRAALVTLVTLCLGVGVAPAEMIAPARVIDVTSPSGKYRVVCTPGKQDSEIELFKSSASVWKTVTDHPAYALATDDGRVITIDRHDHYGGDHAVVIYGPSGKVLVDRRVEELLTADELGGMSSSRGGRRWLAAAPTISKGRLRLPLGGGTTVEIRLKDGVQLRKGKVFAVPRDEARFRSYVDGKRSYESATVRWWQVDATGTGTYCTADATSTDCSVTANGTTKQTKTTHTPAELVQAIASAAFLAARPRGQQPGDRWVIAFEFKERSYTYSYVWSAPGLASGDVATLARSFGFP
jgi:hypothetical protein